MRRALAADGHAAFVTRVVARAEEWTSGSWDAVLARWARVGVAAAAVIVVLTAGYLLRPGAAIASPSLSVADAVLSQPGDAQGIVTAVLGN